MADQVLMPNQTTHGHPRNGFWKNFGCTFFLSSSHSIMLCTWLTWIDCLLRGPRPLLCKWPRPAPFHIRLSVLDMPHMLTVFFLLLSRWDLCKSWVWPSLTSWNIKIYWNYFLWVQILNIKCLEWLEYYYCYLVGPLKVLNGTNFILND